MDKHCEEALDRLFEYIDGELPDADVKELAEHLKKCPPCETEHRIAERIKKMVSRCPQETAPERLRERIFAIVAQARGTE
jgi:mycothiol system anti-sigma-R factor